MNSILFKRLKKTSSFLEKEPVCLSLMVRIAFQRTSIEVSFSSSDNVLRAEVKLIKQNHTTSLSTSRCRSNKQRVIPAFLDATAEVGDYQCGQLLGERYRRARVPLSQPIELDDYCPAEIKVMTELNQCLHVVDVADIRMGRHN